MVQVFKKILYIIIFFFFFQQPLMAESINIFEFTKEEMKVLKVRKVKGKTTYTLGFNQNGNFLKAEAKGKGSGLGKEVKIDIYVSTRCIKTIMTHPRLGPSQLFRPSYCSEEILRKILFDFLRFS